MRVESEKLRFKHFKKPKPAWMEDNLRKVKISGKKIDENLKKFLQQIKYE